MKKIIISILALVCTVSAYAQYDERELGTTTAKNDYNILPAAGDFAIGIDANPFLEYAIGLFNGANAPTFDGFDGNLYGKYFLTDNTAVRVRLNFDFDNQMNRHVVADDGAIALNPLNPLATAFDIEKIKTSAFGINLGYEYRRGYGRLQAFMGADLGFMVGSAVTTYEWANVMNNVNQAPSSAIPGGAIAPGNRLLEVKQPKTFGFGVNPFIGVEFFFARKMSVGGQLGFGLSYAGANQTLTTSQHYNVATNVVDELTVRNAGGDRNWNFSTNLNANIFLMFHF